MLSGVFERFPRLKFVMTEMGCAWIPPMLAQLDGMIDEHPRRRCASASSGTRRSTSSPQLGDRVLPAELLGRREPARPGRRRGAQVRSASTGSCGAATTRTTRARARSRVSTCARCSTTPTRRSCRASSRATRPSSTTSTSTRSQPIADQFGPTVAEIAEPLDGAAREREPRADPGIQGVEVVTLDIEDRSSADA